MMKCKNCGFEFDEGCFCPECGTKYEESVNENVIEVNNQGQIQGRDSDLIEQQPNQVDSEELRPEKNERIVEDVLDHEIKVYENKRKAANRTANMALLTAVGTWVSLFVFPFITVFVFIAALVYNVKAFKVKLDKKFPLIISTILNGIILILFVIGLLVVYGEM